VIDRKDNQKNTQLLAYVSPHPGASVTELDLRNFLNARLPVYMMPSFFMMMDSFPVTSNGKLDRKALPSPETITRPNQKSVEWFSPSEAALAGIWVELLGVVEPSKRDSFFDLGGHSLVATRMVNRIKEVFSVDLPVTTIFRVPVLAELAERIDNMQYGDQEVSQIVASVNQECLPLSYAQERIWLAEQLAPGSSLFNIPIVLEITGPFDRAIAEKALQGLLDRHAVLRATYALREGRPVQNIADQLDVPIRFVDFSDCPGSQQENALMSYLEAEAAVPFDLSRGPMLCAHLLCLEPQRHVFFFKIHHIASDLWSAGIILREFLSSYAAMRQGRQPTLPPLSIQYPDFARWERARLERGLLDRQLSYWSNQLAGADFHLEVPGDRPRPPVQGLRGGIIRTSLSTDLVGMIHVLRKQAGVTLYVVLLAAFKALLARYSGRTDIIVGSDVAVREPSQVEGLIGIFVNQIVLRTDLSGVPSFLEVLSRVRDTVLQGIANRSVPLQVVAEHLQIRHDRSRSPLFQILFDLQQYQLPSEESVEFQIRRLDINWSNAKYDLSLFMEEEGEDIRAALEYNTDLFDEPTVRRFLTHYVLVLDAAVRNPSQPINEFALVGEPAQQRLVADFNENLELA
jgi:hypothetical protein